MTLRPLPRSRLDRIVPALLQESALVVLVPVGDDARWSAEAAWGVARAATTGTHGSRRAVALVDLCLDAPQLHQVKGVESSPGIAEAFASDAPLNEVEQDIDGVHFLPAGSDLSAPGAVLGSARWDRLHAGFRAEDALLLLCVPAERLAELGTVPDGVLALAPAGVDLGSLAGRALLAARERGIPLLGAVRERWTAPQLPARTRRPQGVRPGFVALAAALAIVSVALLATAKESYRTTTKETSGAATKESFKTTAKQSSEFGDLVAVDLPVLPAAAPGAWTLQLAAYGEPERAQAFADRLAAAELPAFVSPMAPDASGAVWYRVQVGGYATRAAAAAAREACWRRGLAARGEGNPLLAPYSLALRHAANAARVRAASLAPVRWGAQGQVLVGAFEHPEQAAVARAHLARAGIPTTLITRTERTP